MSDHALDDRRKRVQNNLTLLYKRLNPASTLGQAMYRLTLDEIQFLRFATLAVLNANDETPKRSNEECLENAIRYADMLDYEKENTDVVQNDRGEIY